MGKQRVTNEDFKSYEERRRDAYIAYAQEQWGKPENSAASETHQSGAYSDESPAAYSARQEREGAERPASVLWLDQQRPKQYEENSAVDHYLANPQNVNRLYLQYQTDERFRDPDYSKEEVSQVYDYYKTRNRGRRVEDWQGAGLNDPIVPILAQLPNRQERAFTSDEIYGYQPTEREAGFFTPQRVGSWDELDLAGKIGRATDASADLSEAGLGWKAVHAISKVVQSTLGGAAVGGIGGAGIGAAAGLVTGPGAAVASAAGGTVGAIGGGVYGLASGIVEAASGKQLPGYTEAMAAFNKGAEKIEQGLGTAAVFRERTLRGYGRGINRANQENANFKDRLLLTIQEMGAEWARGKEEIGDIWEASKQSYEVGLSNAGDLWGDFLTAMFTKPAEGAPTGYERMFNSRRDYQPESIFTGIGETYRWNEGLSGKRKVDENTRGITGLETLIQMRKNMREQGLTDDQINEIQTRIVQLSTGYSGVQTDQIVQSIVDPMNFLNLGAGAILDKIADATGDAAMKAAVKANRGNAFIDALPMYADDIATAATGLNKSGGLTQILSTYADIVKTINVDELTSFQRRLAGIADDGVLKQFAKGDYSGRMGWLKRWVDLTPESKVIGIDGMTSNFLRTMLADAEPEQIRSLLRQAAGLEEIAADSPYRDFFNSAEVRTIRPGLQNVLNDDSSLAALNSYELSVRPRQELERIARELEIRPDEVVEMYETKRNLFDTLVQTLRNADGTEIDLDAAHRTVDYFTGENAIPYQKEALRYRIVSQITDRLGDQLIQKYDIQPDPFIYRIGDTIKQAQSLFLLGTSPTFFVNNVVNNLITRAATGIFGFLDSESIRKQQERFGFNSTRISGLFDNEFGGDNVSGIEGKIARIKRKDDLLGRTQDAISAVNDKIGVFGKLSSKAEEFESNQAISIGLSQYMDRVWAQGEGVPEIPEPLRAILGDELSDSIVRAVRGSWNLDEIDDALFSKDYIRPDAGQVLAESFRERFKDASGFEEIFGKTGIADALAERIKGAETPEAISDAVTDVLRQATKYNSIRVLNDVAAQKDSIRARVENEGIYAVADAFRDLAVSETEYWIDSRIQYSDAYHKVVDLLDKKLDYPEKAMTLLNEIQIEGWENLRKKRKQAHAGIVEGLGFSDADGASYMKLLTEIDDIWDAFYQEKHSEYERYWELTERYPAIRGGLWQQFQEESNSKYSAAADREVELQAQLYQVFLDSYQRATGQDAGELNAVFETMTATRKEMIALQNEAHAHITEQAGSKDYVSLTEYYDRNIHPRYNELIERLYQSVEELGRKIDESAPPPGGEASADRQPGLHSPQPLGGGEASRQPGRRMTPEEAYRAQRANQEATFDRVQATDQVEGYQAKERIRRRFLEDGYGRGTVDLIMNLYDATAAVWEGRAENEGKNFYAEAQRRAQAGQATGNEFRVIAGRQALRGIQDAQNLGETLHAIGQGFYRTLPQDTAEAYAQWLGYKDAATYEAIDQRYRKKKLTAKEVERYEAAADRFRIEFESYLAKGKFDYDFEPVLIQARQYLNGVYRAVRDSLPPSDTESLLAYRISGGELRGILDQIPDNRDYGSYGSLLAKYEREGRDGRLSVRSRLQDKFSDGDSAAEFLGQMQGVVYIDGVPLTHDGLRDAIADIFGRGETWGKYANRTMDSAEVQAKYAAAEPVWLSDLDGMDLSGKEDFLTAKVFHKNAADQNKRQEMRDYYDWYFAEGSPIRNDPDDPGYQDSYAFQYLDADEQRAWRSIVYMDWKDNGLLRDTWLDHIAAASSPIFVRSPKLQYGGYDIAGRVYYNGDQVAVLPETKHGFPSSFTDGERTIRFLGLDPEDADQYVLLSDGEIIKAKANGINGAAMTENADEVLRKVKHGKTPTPIPEGTAGNEVFHKFIVGTLNQFEGDYRRALAAAKVNGRFESVPEAARTELNRWLNEDVRAALGKTKYQANQYAEAQRDYALLNYSKKYGFDRMATLAFPYQFWITRSLGTWARRMIDRPEYYRALFDRQEVERLYEEKGLPKRLQGRAKIPMMGFEPWMGDSYYTNFGQLNPLTTLTSGFRQYDERMAAVEREAEELLRERYEAGRISQAEYDEALTHTGGHWTQALAEARESSDDQVGIETIARSFFSPNLLVDWAIKKYQGRETDIGHLPSTRTGGAIRSFTDGTFAEPVGELVQGALSAPELALRKLYGLSYHEFGEKWGDYLLAKQLANMAADGVITHDEAREAMITKDGTVYEEAEKRQRQENALKVPLMGMGAAIRNAVEGKGGLEQLPVVLANLISGGLVYPTGERKGRMFSELLSEAYEAKANGDKDAVNRVYREHPEGMTRKLTFSETPDEMLRMFYEQRIKDVFYKLPRIQQQAVKHSLGPNFEHGVINPETRSDAVPLEQLAEWAAALSGRIPNLPHAPKAEDVPEIVLYSAATADEEAAHDAEMAARFPENIYTIQNGYFEQPSKTAKAAYLTANPILKQYWDWNKAFKAAHPLYAQYRRDEEAYREEVERAAVYAALSERTLGVLDMMRWREGTLPAGVRRDLERAYEEHGQANEGFDDFVARLVGK